jgi:cyclophilin family peptidyl-prolyl cis-trans isomerase
VTIRSAAAVVLLLAIAAGGQFSTSSRLADDYNRRSLILGVEDARSPAPAALAAVIAIAREEPGPGPALAETRRLAIRALGRLERRDLIPVLLPLLQNRAVGDAAASSLLLTLRAHAAEHDPEIESATDRVLHAAQSSVVLRHLPYTKSQQVELAESKLLLLAKDPTQYGSVAASFEVLARRHWKLHPLDEQSLAFLRSTVRRTLSGMLPSDHFTPRVALAALAAAGQADEDVIRAGLRDHDEQVRRTAMVALQSAGALIDAALRTELTSDAFGDRSPFVRYEAVRAWSRRETKTHGCGPLVTAVADLSLHVALAAIDALGTACAEDDAITARLGYEAATPPTVGEWHRGAHAFLALARRAPETAAAAMPRFKGHLVWQVRMYAARAASAMKDVETLERLAYDDNDNVREATLAAVRTLKQDESNAVFIAALGRSDYQLLRTAAMALKGAAPSQDLLAALVNALERVTAEKKDTSRDTRIALLEQIRAMGSAEQLPLYQRLLRDFDPEIAGTAALACSAVSSRQCVADPQLQSRPPLPSPPELFGGRRAVIELDNGRRFDIVLNRDVAPLAATRFTRLAAAHYYDGLTFHRIVPNYIIQGGSPGANEYAGDGPYMRDELGGAHRRGAVGISTRGLHTGDAQIFVNLVDNPTLDMGYTVLGSVPQDHMPAVDTIQEGTRIVRVSLR